MDPSLKAACRPPPSVARGTWDVLGLSSIKRLKAADTEKQVPSFFLATFRELSEAAGRECPTATMRFLHHEFIITADPENAKAILATQFNDFEFGWLRRKFLENFLGDGIFIADGREWEHFRAIVRPAFARDQISDLEPQTQHCECLLDALNSKVDDATGWTEAVDLRTFFHRHTLDVATHVLFGESVDSQRAAMADDDDEAFGYQGLEFAKAFDRATTLAALGGGGSWWQWWEAPEYKSSKDIINKFVDHYVELALEATNSVDHGDGDKADRKSHKYIFSHEVANQTRDPVEIRSQLLHILVAGKDTTAELLTWLFKMLSIHPGIYEKLRSIIISHFGTTEAAGPHELSFASLKACSYLQHCLLETLRLNPPLPGSRKIAVRDTTLPRGGGPLGEDPIFVAKGTHVEIHGLVMQQRKSLWGEDASEFKPERWEGRKMGWDYIAFNGGPRVCPGQQFALTTAGYAVVRLLQQFDKIESADSDPIKYDLRLTLNCFNGAKVKLHR